LGLCWATWPLMLIAADEYSPILHVPGSVTVGCLMAGFVMLAIVTLVRLPAALAQGRLPCDAHPELHVGASA
ncbi:MAG: TRAP transporter small permease, partial [Ramlibacter sp.]